MRIIPAPKRQPAILPTADLSIVLSSFIFFLLSFSAEYPSKIPAMPSVIALPTTPPMIAPVTPAKWPPIIARTAKIPLSIMPNITSGWIDFIFILKGNKDRTQTIERRIKIKPINLALLTKKKLTVKIIKHKIKMFKIDRILLFIVYNFFLSFFIVSKNRLFGDFLL